MVKVTECCCGCSLRTGSLILLWITLISESIVSLGRLVVLSAPATLDSEVLITPYTEFRTVCYLIISIVGITVSILGIHGIQKNLPKRLDGIFYYFCFQVIADSIQVIFMVVSPSSYVKIFDFIPTSGMPSDSELRKASLMLALGTSFGIALTIYFAVVLKSCRDAMIERRRENGFVHVTDPTAIGYNNAA